MWVAVISATLIATTASAQDNYRVRPGDTLTVEVLEDPALNRNVLVLPDGRFSFPFAGTVQAGGRTIGEISAALTRGIASNFAAEPNVFVSIQQLRAITPRGTAPATMEIFFLGEVNNPGPKAVRRNITLLQALATSGGFSKFAAQKRIQLRRTDRSGNQSVYTVNYKALSNGATGTPIVLQEGDVILVPERRLFE